MRVWTEELWRLGCGGGIAGNAGCWWLTRLGPTKETWGPFTTRAELEIALRAWRDYTDILDLERFADKVSAPEKPTEQP